MRNLAVLLLAGLFALAACAPSSDTAAVTPAGSSSQETITTETTRDADSTNASRDPESGAPVAEADLIVPGVRIGEIAIVGEPAPTGLTESAGEVQEWGESVQYSFRAPTGEMSHEIGICKDTGLVQTVAIRNIPPNRRFRTSEGLSLASSEAEVIAALGEPDVHHVPPSEGGLEGLFYEDENGAHLGFWFPRQNKNQALFILVSGPDCT